MEKEKYGALSGKRIINTRGAHQAQELSRLLHDEGAIVLELPTICIGSPADFAPLDEAIDSLKRYDMLLFTSANSVEFFLKRLEEKGKDAKDLEGIMVGAVGAATRAKLEGARVQVSFQPESFTSEDLARGLESAELLQNKQILLPRSDIAPADFVSGMRSRGALVHDVVAYRTIPETKFKEYYLRFLMNKEIDVITFTSSSTFENLISLMERTTFDGLREGFTVASIGPATSRTMGKYNVKPDVEAAEHTIPGLVKAIVEYWEKK